MIEESKAYRVLLLDPPWNENGGGGRGAQCHYPIMKSADIERLLVEDERIPDVMHEASVCFMWVTNNFLEDGLALMRALGFEYITNFVWTKDRFGLGYYARGQHELCLFGRTKAWKSRPKKAMPSWLGQDAIARREHSRKPDEMHETIETMFDGPYLELFARREREGWDVWGNEIEEGK